MRRSFAPSQRKENLAFKQPKLTYDSAVKGDPTNGNLSDGVGNQATLRTETSCEKNVRQVLQESTDNVLVKHNSPHQRNEIPSKSYFSCIWAKKSSRKHKKWEGDGFIEVGERSIVLIDDAGKELSRGSGYKIAILQELEDGSQIAVGSKEIQIESRVESDIWDSKVRKERCTSETEHETVKGDRGLKRKKMSEEEAEDGQTRALRKIFKAKNFKAFKIPRRTDGAETFTRARSVAPGIPMFDPSKEGALVLPRPPVGHNLRTDRLVDVVLDPYISSKLRVHQRSGILFLYANILGFKTLSSEQNIPCTIRGAILADDMGLGKTLQSVALIWTLIKQSPVAGCTLAKKILIVAPTSLLRNWEDEFKKWLGAERIIVHVADSTNKVSIFKSYTNAPVLVVSYEVMVRSESELRDIKWDVIFCDEAHRLKNAEIKTSICLSRFQCESKILLTGTPVQNDLNEYFSLMSIVAPNLLGTKSQFNSEFVSVIEKGREPCATEEQTADANAALSKLGHITARILLRRTSDIISKYLPPKTINIVFCRPSDFQSVVYSREVSALYESVVSEPGNHLSAVSNLKKICNSPYLLDEIRTSDIPAPNTWEEQSGKLSVLTCFLLTLIQTSEEKIVMVSLSTSTLDLLSTLCDRYSIPTVRLDGKTPPASRMQLVKEFNSPSSTSRVFLLSSKAGGSGLNLTGASRIVLYDMDWNPATDSQAMARIWRTGQKNHCRIYRLITTGTIEEKIFQRQVMKSGLAGGVESNGLGGDSVAQFTSEELKDLFTFRENIECETHDLLECNCGGSGAVAVLQQSETQRKCQLGEKVSIERSRSNMEQLKSWRHYSFPIQNQEDECLNSAQSFISYLFCHFEDSSED